jgi:hypothetical protein
MSILIKTLIYAVIGVILYLMVYAHDKWVDIDPDDNM